MIETFERLYNCVEAEWRYLVPKAIYSWEEEDDHRVISWLVESPTSVVGRINSSE